MSIAEFLFMVHETKNTIQITFLGYSFKIEVITVKFFYQNNEFELN